MALNFPFQAAATALGAGLNFLSARQNNRISQSVADRNLQLQEEFARNGVRWKVEDAKAAGIHPLAALGANISSPAPVGVNLDRADLTPALSSMGQSIDRAVAAKKTEGERAAQMAVQTKLNDLTIERTELENESLRLQNRKMLQSLPPPMPVLGRPVQQEFLELPTRTSDGGHVIWMADRS